MKRVLIVLIWLLYPMAIYAQFDFSPYPTRRPIVSTQNDGLYGDNMTLFVAEAPESSCMGEHVYYIQSSTNAPIPALFILYLGSTPEESLATIRRIKGAINGRCDHDTLKNVRYECYLRVVNFEKSGRGVEMRMKNKPGVVFVDDRTFSIMEDALNHYDERTMSSFAYEKPSDILEAKTEIGRYKNYLAEGRPGGVYTFYGEEYTRLFKKRIKEYKSDLRKMK